MTNALYKIGEISGKNISIDGTKIEANANKYIFVWRKAVTKNRVKLLIKVIDFIAKCDNICIFCIK